MTTSTPAVRTASCLNEFIALQKKSDLPKSSPLHHHHNGNNNNSRISTPAQQSVRSVTASASPSSNYLNAFLAHHKMLDCQGQSQCQLQHSQRSISIITRSDDSSYMSIREQPSSSFYNKPSAITKQFDNNTAASQ